LIIFLVRPFILIRRNTRLTQLPETSYKEDINNLEYLLDRSDNKNGGEKGTDQEIKLDDDRNKNINSIKPA
jgi:hypothetical protein